jgi:hypothetical protein
VGMTGGDPGASLRGMRRRIEERWRTPFGGWVGRVTVAGIVNELGKNPALAVRPSQVYAWVAGIAMPRPSRALALVRMSRGTITLDAIYRHGQEVRRHRGGRSNSEPEHSPTGS